MAARAAWTGAITFAGFPIHVQAYNATKSKNGDSFKTVCPCHGQPIKQQLVCGVSGEQVERGSTGKAIEVSKTQHVRVPDETLDAIAQNESTGSVEVERFAPLASVPLALSQGSFRLAPNGKVPGSDQPVSILWNGLRATQRAAIIEGWTPRSSTAPAVLVVHADEDGLVGNVLPFVGDLQSAPGETPEVNEQAAAMFTQVIEASYSTESFDHGAYVNHYGERRARMLEQVIAGEPVTVSEDAPATTPVPDLMAAMNAALEAAPPTGKKAGKKVKDAVA